MGSSYQLVVLNRNTHDQSLVRMMRLFPGCTATPGYRCSQGRLIVKLKKSTQQIGALALANDLD